MSGTLNTSEAEYAKDPNIKSEDIRSLQQWLEKESHLPNTSEYSIIQFYQACDYSIQQTKRVLELHYTYKNEAPEFYTGKDFAPPKYNHSFWDVAYCFDLPKPSLKGFRGFYMGLKDKDPAKYNFQVFSTMQTKCMMTLILEQGICPGYSIILDFEGCTFSHLAAVNLLALKKFTYLAQETSQMKMREIHLINGPGIVDKFLVLLKPFLKKELLESIYVHSSIQTFSDHFGKDNIPVDIGGELSQTRDILTKNFRKRVDLLSNDVQAELDKRADDSLRIGGKQNNSPISCGSFKRISID